MLGYIYLGDIHKILIVSFEYYFLYSFVSLWSSSLDIFDFELISFCFEIFSYLPDLLVCISIFIILIVEMFGSPISKDGNFLYRKNFYFLRVVLLSLIACIGYFFFTYLLFIFSLKFPNLISLFFLWFFTNKFVSENIVLETLSMSTLFYKLIVSILYFYFIFVFSRLQNESKKKYQIDGLIFFFLAYELVCILLGTNSLLLVLTCICGISIVTYVLIAFRRTYIALEAAIKYFFLSAFTAGLMSLGYLFIVQQNLFFEALSKVICFQSDYFLPDLPLDSNYKFLYLLEEFIWNGSVFYNLGVVLFFFGFFFKLSLFPCHIWAPDVYDGSSMAIVIFLVVIIKAVMFFILTKFVLIFIPRTLILYDFKLLKDFFGFSWFSAFFLVSGFFSVVVGTLGALQQQKIKRFIAFTSINQMGLMLLGLVYSFSAVASILNLLVYVTTSFVILTVILGFKKNNLSFLFRSENHNEESLIYMSDLHNLFMSSPYLVFIFTLVFLSASGMPPFLGFFSKYFIFLSVLHKNIILAILILLFHIVGMYNYLRILRDIWFNTGSKQLFFYFVSDASFKNVLSVFAFSQVILVFFIDFIVDIIFFSVESGIFLGF